MPTDVRITPDRVLSANQAEYPTEWPSQTIALSAFWRRKNLSYPDVNGDLGSRKTCREGLAVWASRPLSQSRKPRPLSPFLDRHLGLSGNNFVTFLALPIRSYGVVPFPCAWVLFRRDLVLRLRDLDLSSNIRSRSWIAQALRSLPVSKMA